VDSKVAEMRETSVVGTLDALARVGALDSCLETLAVFLATVGTLTVASSNMGELRDTEVGYVRFELGLERGAVARKLVLHGCTAGVGELLCVLAVVALAAVAQDVCSEALAVELEALGALAVALFGGSLRRNEVHCVHFRHV